MNNIWEEKSYTEPEKNFLSCNVLGQEGITSEIKNDSTNNKCKDIGKKWERTCHSCSSLLSYSDKYKLLRAEKTGSKCIKCCNKHPPDNNIYFRFCPKCNRRLDYITKGRFALANKNNSKCKSCARPESARGRVASQEARKNMSLAQTGRKHSNETKRKMRGEGNGMYGVYRCGEQNPFYGKKHTEETRKKMRLAMCKKIVQKNKETGQIANVNPNETKYFAKLDREMGWNGIFYGKSSEQHLLDIGYFVDYYEPTLNIVVEYDEPRHYKCGNLRSRDVERMNNIKTALGCRFLRYNEKTGLITEY